MLQLLRVRSDAKVSPCNLQQHRPTFLISSIFILSNLDLCENNRVVVRVLPRQVNLSRYYLRRINHTGQTAWLTRQKRLDPCENVFLFRADTDGSEAAVEGAPPPGEERLDQLQRGRRSAGFWQHQRRSNVGKDDVHVFFLKVACHFG